MSNANTALLAAATFEAGLGNKSLDNLMENAANFKGWLDESDEADRKFWSNRNVSYGREPIRAI